MKQNKIIKKIIVVERPREAGGTANVEALPA
jgi:hypothetical protein